MCLTCCANVRTPLNSPWVGAKLNLSSGMASAPETTSDSPPLSDLFRTAENVGFWSLMPCALATVEQIELPRANSRIAIITSFFTDASTENSHGKADTGEHCNSIRIQKPESG